MDLNLLLLKAHITAGGNCEWVEAIVWNIQALLLLLLQKMRMKAHRGLTLHSVRAASESPGAQMCRYLPAKVERLRSRVGEFGSTGCPPVNQPLHDALCPFPHQYSLTGSLVIFVTAFTLYCR